MMLIHCHLFMQQLEGLEHIFQYALLQIELKSDKWKKLNITTWRREECIKSRLQTDGYIPLLIQTCYSHPLSAHPSPSGYSFFTERLTGSCKLASRDLQCLGPSRPHWLLPRPIHNQAAMATAKAAPHGTRHGP